MRDDFSFPEPGWGTRSLRAGVFDRRSPDGGTNATKRRVPGTNETGRVHRRRSEQREKSTQSDAVAVRLVCRALFDRMIRIGRGFPGRLSSRYSFREAGISGQEYGRFAVTSDARKRRFADCTSTHHGNGHHAFAGRQPKNSFRRANTPYPAG